MAMERLSEAAKLLDSVILQALNYFLNHSSSFIRISEFELL